MCDHHCRAGELRVYEEQTVRAAPPRLGPVTCTRTGARRLYFADERTAMQGLVLP